jgi:hypothetical protein
VNPIDRLLALTYADIEALTARRLIERGNVAAWEKEMRASLTRAHTAAYVLGTAERLGSSDPALINARNISRAERAEIKAAIEKQMQYLKGFSKAVGDGSMSARGITARAALYAGSLRATYNTTRWGDFILPFVPGDGSSECLGRCGCQIEVSDSGDGTGLMRWILSGLEWHCQTCPSRASGGPYKVERRRV